MGQRESALENLVKTWQGRRVFLTGHTGFKGGWLALWLARLGAQVRGYALDPVTEPNLFTVAGIGSVLEDVRGDLLDRTRLEAAVQEFEPEVVFHLAAQPLVRRSYADPLSTYATNVMGTAHVLETVRKTPSVRAVVCVTTDKCYENREWVWPYRETDALGGHDPYSSSKACAEIVSAAYRSSFFSAGRPGEPGVLLATARAGNVMGGGDWSEDRLIPDLIRGFQTGKPVLIRRPQAIRPWQHVLEPVHGYILLAERLLAEEPRFASAFNFGPGDEGAWTVERIADYLAAGWGDGAKWIRDTDPGVHEAGVLRLDASRARGELGWQPRLDIESALEWTVDWYRACLEQAAMGEHTSKQIEKYELLQGRG
ncbi:MAG TPA: CDP-glucose 4,6-dehydratase [Acidobacteriaceae bacterium]|jgi:CDP-glucose 4,6-dehydratase|nr:CDP-glucose 4,6-dehydratase [Acidobacteriaceae bacterium]